MRGACVHSAALPAQWPQPKECTLNTLLSARRSLPAAWRGLRDAKLSEVSGIPGCTFVHAGGFIGGCDTLEGVAEMARKALEIE